MAEMSLIKEADETEYWLLICRMSKNYPNPENYGSTINKQFESTHKAKKHHSSN